MWLRENASGPEYLGPEADKVAKSAQRIAAGGVALLAFVPFSAGAVAYGLGRLYLLSRREILRIERRSFWERTDPPTYLAPGSTTTIETRYTAGLSATQRAELSTTLGQSVGVNNIISLTTTYNETTRVGGSLTASLQKSVSRTLQIRNPMLDKDYRYAIWRPGYEITTSVLRINNDALSWQRLGRYEFLVESEVATTGISVSR